MTKRSKFTRHLSAAVVGAAALFAASAAAAQCGSCGPNYEPGLLAALANAFSASASPNCVNCAPVKQGEYRVNQGPVYSGPAAVAPQPTYRPTQTAAGYPYVSGSDPVSEEEVGEPIRKRVYPAAPARRVFKRTRVAKVEVRPAKKGAPQVIRAIAEVKIYGPERMDIRLMRAKK